MKTPQQLIVLWLAIVTLLVLSHHHTVAARPAITALPRADIHAVPAQIAAKKEAFPVPLEDTPHTSIGDTAQKQQEAEFEGEEYIEDESEYDIIQEGSHSTHSSSLFIAFLRVLFLPQTLVSLWCVVAVATMRLVYTHMRRYVYPAIQKCYTRLALALLAAASLSALTALGWLQNTMALPVFAAGNAFLGGYVLHLLYYALPVLYVGGETQAFQILEVSLETRSPETAHYPTTLRVRAGESLFGCKAAMCCALYMGGLLQVTHLVLAHIVPHGESSHLRMWIDVSCLVIESCACLLAIVRGTTLWDGMSPYCQHLTPAAKKLLFVPFVCVRAVQQVACLVVLGDVELGMRMAGGLYLLATCVVAALALWELSADSDSLLTLLPPHHTHTSKHTLSISGEPYVTHGMFAEGTHPLTKLATFLACHDTLPGISSLCVDPQMTERVRSVLRHHEALSRGLLRRPPAQLSGSGKTETATDEHAEGTHTCWFIGRVAVWGMNALCLGQCLRRRTQRPKQRKQEKGDYNTKHTNETVELINGTPKHANTKNAHTLTGSQNGVWQSAGSFIFDSCTYFISEFWTRRKFNLDESSFDVETGEASETSRLLDSPVEQQETRHEETETMSPRETCACADTGDARSDSTGSGTASDTENDH